jgi:UDP-N-acetylglucosamine--N-acetylmuramyl-(pentapeptide) pyrophosphoryl-undecaprenol N-acetylglucosamine transferase
MTKRIIIAGGGTGGHIFPAIAIANALKKKDEGIEIFFVGAKGKMEMEKVPQAGYKIKGLDIAGFNRSSLMKNIGLPFKLIKSFFQVRSIINEFQPNAVIGVGGYSSFPVLRFAQSKGIKTFIHESNSFAGKANIWLGKKATKVFVASEGMQNFFPEGKIVITGNPIRKSIGNVALISKSEALKFFGLTEGRQTVLAVGGSLGARSINEAVELHLGELEKHNLQIIWQTGNAEVERWKEAAKGFKNVWVGPFIKEMEYGYAAADVVISRAGAMAVAELCVVGKPVVFVPYPFAAEDHQTANAQALVKQGAACMVKDSEAKEAAIANVIQILEDEKKGEQLKTNIAQYAVLNADEIIADEILKSINK